MNLIISIKEISNDDYDNLIVNRTDETYLVDIIHVGLKLLDIKGTRIIISNIPTDYTPPDNVTGTVHGFIRYYAGDYYGIYIAKADEIESINILSHELIHLHQYYSKRLKQGRKYYIWKNDTLYKPLKYSYTEKPWEIEAREIGDMLNFSIKSLIID
jgi:regulatory protein YycI of two-component signal transduction system YycFG